MQPRSLDQFYDAAEPRTFEDILGQSAALEFLANEVLQATGTHSFVAGSWGMGKTTLAKIYAHALTCLATDRSQASPCLTCENCRADGNVVNDAHRLLNSKALKPGDLALIIAGARRPRFDGARTVLIFDEAQGLSASCADFLVGEMKPVSSKYFTLIFTTDKPKAHKRIQQRCKVLRIEPVPERALISWGLALCKQFELPHNVSTLSDYARAAQGTPRRFLNSLHNGRNSADDKSQHNSILHATIELLQALLSLDLQASHKLLQVYDASALHDSLISMIAVLERDSLNVIQEDNMRFVGLDESMRSLRLAGSSCAAQLGLVEPQFWYRLRKTLNAEIVKTIDALWFRIIDASHIVAGDALPLRRDVSLPHAKVSRTRLNNVSPRPHIRPNPAPKLRGYLTIDDAVQLWDAASFQAQYYGRYFNMSIDIRHAQLGLLDDRQSVSMVGRLLKELAARINTWGDEPMHWLYSHSKDINGLRTFIACQLPDASIKAAKHWLHARHLARHFPQADVDSVRLDSPSKPDINSAAAFHRRLVVTLCRCIDPRIELRNPRRRLIDELDLATVPIGSYQELNGIREFAIAKPLRRTALDHIHPVLHPLTPARDGAWNYRNPCWEMKEHSDLVNLAKQIDADPSSTSSSDITPTERRRSWPTAVWPGWWH